MESEGNDSPEYPPFVQPEALTLTEHIELFRRRYGGEDWSWAAGAGSWRVTAPTSPDSMIVRAAESEAEADKEMAEWREILDRAKKPSGTSSRKP